MIFTETLHKDNITKEEIRMLYKWVCDHSDGVDLPLLRSQFGLKDDDDTLFSWYRSLFYSTKSKMVSTFKFCLKQFLIGVMFGIRGEGNVITRQGTNEHLLMDKIFNKLDSSKLKENYIKTRSIKKYLIEQLKELTRELIGGDTFKDALNKIDNSEGERNHYKSTIVATAAWLNKRYEWLDTIVGLNRIDEYFYPIGTEVELYDPIARRHGLIDAIYKNPYGGYIVVDYKFGKPKRKKDYYGNPTDEPYYYMPSVYLELWFYKWLAESPNAFEADENEQKIVKWTALNCTRGEMWYMLDIEFGQLYTSFDYKDEVELLKLEQDYWNRMNNMDYDYDPHLGWKEDRFRKLCNVKKEDGSYRCEMRQICNHFKSFQEYVNEETLENHFFEEMENEDF